LTTVHLSRNEIDDRQALVELAAAAASDVQPCNWPWPCCAHSLI